MAKLLHEIFTVARRDPVDDDVVWLIESPCPLVRYGQPFEPWVGPGSEIHVYGDGRIIAR